jgi:uncharacterized protein (UPF0335 family)
MASLDPHRMMYDMLREQRAGIERIEEELSELKGEVKSLKKQASIWGAVSGGITAIPATAIALLKSLANG